MSHDHTNLVSIGKVVEELSAEYPDVTHSSLRFLENEGLARPTRTPGGHRLYSPEDIARIRRIKEWQRQHLSLSEIRERLEAAEQIDDPRAVAWRFLDLAAAGDLPAAQAAVLGLSDLGFSLEQIFQQVLTPALHELGRRWQSGELLVGQEKEISALSRDLIAELSLRAAHEPRHDRSVVAACVEGEYHELGLRMIVGLVQAHGYIVHYLGPSVSPTFLLESVRLRQPAVVLLSATLESHFDAVRETVTELQAELPAESMPKLVIGGQIVPVLRDRLIDLGVQTSRNGDIETTVSEVLDLIGDSDDGV
jgi:DNA-binding transcriptional MerR regulator